MRTLDTNLSLLALKLTGYSVMDGKGRKQNAGESFTILGHERFRSDAANQLSMGALGLLAEFETVWMRATGNRKNHVHHVSFVWSGSQRNVSRYRFDKFKKELVDKGFIEVVNLNAGRYRASEKWQSYEPTPHERERCDKIQSSRTKQRTETIQYRSRSAKKASTGNGVCSAKDLSTVPTAVIEPSAQELGTVETPTGAKELSNPQCANSEQQVVREKPAHNNTSNTDHYPIREGGEENHISSGLQETLDSLGRTMQQKEQDPDFTRERAQREKSLAASTEEWKTPSQCFKSEFRACVESKNLRDPECRAEAADIIGQHIGFSDAISKNRIFGTMKGIGQDDIETLVVQVLEAKGIDSLLGLLLSKLKILRECLETA